jgi:hypothetical protein
LVGSQIWADAVGADVAEATPPVIITRPSLRRVTVCPVRGIRARPVGDHDPVPAAPEVTVVRMAASRPTTTATVTTPSLRGAPALSGSLR